MISVILISHSRQITDGIKEMIQEMQQDQDKVMIHSVGGTDDGRLGTDPMRVMQAIDESRDSNHIFVFADIGSAIMTAEMTLDMLDDELKEKVVLVDAPLIEGAFSAAVTGSFSDDPKTIIAEAQAAAQQKFNH